MVGPRITCEWSALQIFLQLKYFLPDPIKNDVKYQVSCHRSDCPVLMPGRLHVCIRTHERVTTSSS